MGMKGFFGEKLQVEQQFPFFCSFQGEQEMLEKESFLAYISELNIYI